MPIRALLEQQQVEEGAVFGPEELQDICKAFDAILKDLGLTDDRDPVTVMVARLTIELANQGQFNAASLRARVLKEMKPKGRVN